MTGIEAAAPPAASRLLLPQSLEGARPPEAARSPPHLCAAGPGGPPMCGSPGGPQAPRSHPTLSLSCSGSDSGGL